MAEPQQPAEPPANGHAFACIPRHVAIIMDGNGRWAKARHLTRQAGHVSGISALRRTVIAARVIGIDYLTVYAFSTENWQRPPGEVSALMGLFRRFFHADMNKLQRENVRVRFIGRRADLAPDIAKLIAEAEAMTETNTGLSLTIAFNYGAREELVSAARAIARSVVDGELEPGDLTEALFEQHLQTSGFPNVDLVIRPGGEKRISNFLLWQAAYAEFVFLDTLWPDFGEDQMRAAIAEYATRERRFGRIHAEHGAGDVTSPQFANELRAATS